MIYDTDYPRGYYPTCGDWSLPLHWETTSTSSSDLYATIKKVFMPIKEWKTAQCVPGIDKVIFNDPATIVIWKDGTKTVVKCMESDTYDKQTGLAMCICKKLYGEAFHRAFREMCKDE